MTPNKSLSNLGSRINDMEHKMKEIEIDEIYNKNNFLASLKYGGLNSNKADLGHIRSNNFKIDENDTTLLKQSIQKNEEITNAGLKRVERKIEKLQELMSNQMFQTTEPVRNILDDEYEMSQSPIKPAKRSRRRKKSLNKSSNKVISKLKRAKSGNIGGAKVLKSSRRNLQTGARTSRKKKLAEKDRILTELVEEVEILRQNNQDLELDLKIADKKFKKLKSQNLKLKKKNDVQAANESIVAKLKTKLRVHKKYIKELTEENEFLKSEITQLKGVNHREEIDFEQNLRGYNYGGHTKARRRKRSSIKSRSRQD